MRGKPKLLIAKFPILVVASLIMLLPGCADNPGKWAVDRVEAKMIERFELEEVSLEKSPSGEIVGTGKTGDGETMPFKLTQDPVAHRLSWEAEGDRGTFEDGFFELK